MKRYPEDAWERAMKVQEVILRALGKKITWWQAAEIIGLSDRSPRRWRGRYEGVRSVPENKNLNCVACQRQRG